MSPSVEHGLILLKRYYKNYTKYQVLLVKFPNLHTTGFPEFLVCGQPTQMLRFDLLNDILFVYLSYCSDVCVSVEGLVHTSHVLLIASRCPGRHKITQWLYCLGDQRERSVCLAVLNRKKMLSVRDFMTILKYCPNPLSIESFEFLERNIHSIPNIR